MGEHVCHLKSVKHYILCKSFCDIFTEIKQNKRYKLKHKWQTQEADNQADERPDI